MNRILAFFRLIRFPNLIIILFTQYMIRYAFLYPYFKVQGFSLQLNESLFFVFALAFTCLAAGGYIINDYYDVKADNINKPGKVIVGDTISPDMALLFYWVLTITGVAIGCWSSTKIGLPNLGLLFFFYASGLWFYTTSFKYMFLVGNLLVALFIAFVPFTAGFVELYTCASHTTITVTGIHFTPLLYGIGAISVFAFLTTLAREIVKDIEDMEGDVNAGCRTLPIVLGVRAGKIAAWLVLLLVFILLGILLVKCIQIKGWLSVIYIIGFIIIPLLLIAVNLFKTKASKDFHKISTWLKLLMLSGISYLFVFAYILLR
jgi:4-hydroxybenzoate polyprenyltransferase